jgi:uncharacterized protein
VTRTAWDGEAFLAALQQATARLALHVDEVNALNVFPVPDGDTGTNMLATLQAAVEEAAAAAAADGQLANVAEAAGTGALMGARGNSGVILSQLFRGIADVLQDKSEIDGRDLARALDRGCDAAFAAVARPVEGTILTVAHDASRAAARAARDSREVEVVLAAAVDEARAAVERTPSQLAVLRHAGVVDAGGRGLEIILLGALGYARGETVAAAAELPHDLVFPAFEALEEDGYGYETVYVVMPAEGTRLDVAAMRSQLEQMGESVLVAGDERAAKIHIHNERPDQVIAYGLSLGSLSRIVVENLDRQAHAVRADHPPSAPDGTEPASADADAEAAFALAPADALSAAPLNHDGRGPVVVAVAPGAGLERVFRALGAAVVRTADGVNASAGELAQAIRATGCREIVVLPNNPNVRLAAMQSGELCVDQEVAVVPTRNPAEGIAAMLALDSGADLARNVEQMLKASRETRTLQVAQAVRDARLGRRRVREGQHIVLDGDQKLVAVDNDLNQAIVQALQRLKGGFELVTLYYGADADERQADELAAVLRREFAESEVEIVEGGQDHYSYLVAAE